MSDNIAVKLSWLIDGEIQQKPVLNSVQCGGGDASF